MKNLRAMDLSTSWNKYPKDIRGRCVGTGCLHTERRHDGQQERVAASIARRQSCLYYPVYDFPGKRL